METPGKTVVAPPFYLAVLLATATGFIALAYELLWARLLNFSSGSRPQAFSAMLGFYLFGLALGSLLSRRWQIKTSPEEVAARWRQLAGLIGVSNIIAFLIVPLASWMMVTSSWVRIVPLIAIGSALLGTILPLLCELAISADRLAGARVSYLYLANIIGSGAGSLLTGFFLMDWLPFWQIAALLLTFSLLVSAALTLFLKTVRITDWIMWSAGAGLVCLAPLLHNNFYARLQLQSEYASNYRFGQVVESRHGVVTVTPERQVFGNGVYDGVIDTDPEPDSGLVRPYFVSAIHPNPKEVLVIGMSGGCWTQILANHPQVEQVTVVEISHAYLKVIANYPQVSGILTNAKVDIHIDDGRRWLRRNPDRRFDAIVMNTTVHWREFASALLSQEFLELTKRHLKPGGFVTWNCTGSYRAARTGMEVFPYTIMIGNFCAGSTAPLTPDRERWIEVLRKYQINGRPVFDLTTPKGREKLEGVSAFFEAPPGKPWRLMYRPEMERTYGQARLITDDNLGEEYRAPLKIFLRSLIPGYSYLKTK